MIQQLIIKNERLKNINDCFLISNSRKDEYLLSIFKNNEQYRDNNLFNLKNRICLKKMQLSKNQRILNWTIQ